MNFILFFFFTIPRTILFILNYDNPLYKKIFTTYKLFLTGQQQNLNQTSISQIWQSHGFEILYLKLPGPYFTHTTCALNPCRTGLGKLHTNTHLPLFYTLWVCLSAYRLRMARIPPSAQRLERTEENGAWIMAWLILHTQDQLNALSSVRSLQPGPPVL